MYTKKGSRPSSCDRAEPLYARLAGDPPHHDLVGHAGQLRQDQLEQTGPGNDRHIAHKLAAADIRRDGDPLFAFLYVLRRIVPVGKSIERRMDDPGPWSFLLCHLFPSFHGFI